MAQGAPEVILTGVDVTSWGHDLPDAPPLGSLVQAVLDSFPQLKRLRMSSLDGIEVDPLLFELFTSEARVMPHIHLSLQHGHDLILKRMKRRHLRNDAVKLVTRLKAARPEIAIGADIIAGFPTETEEHHRSNLSIIRDLEIVHGHIFPYSPRPGSPAALMPQLEKPVIRQRATELRETVSTIKEDWLASLVGQELSVLAERDGSGYSPNFARVDCPAGTQAGKIITVLPKHIEKGLLK
jgi:threonylcarbamoyladenosine tRNA methylthiotransferase MtaB